MKFTVVIFTLLTLYTIDVDCKHTSRVRRRIHIFDTVVNKTRQFKNYVKETGRSLRNFYEDKVENRVRSYFRDGNSNTSITEDIQTKISNKFKGYIDLARKMSSTIYEGIAPANMQHKCEDEADINRLTTTQLTALHGYVSESHAIVTQDGYILTVHRIPLPKRSLSKVSPQKTVLLHHGLLGSSADWVIPGPEKGLAYVFSDAGYDVWMTNVRGNTYSRAHVSKNVNTNAFWNFTFHEVSQYDLPAVIDYIMDKKGANVKINYVAFSMGTSVLFALLSTKTEYNQILRAGFAMAPVAYMRNVKGPLRILGMFGGNIESLMKLLGANEFLPRNAAVRYLSKHSCKIGKVEEAVCEMTMFMMCGHDKVQFDRTLVPMIYGHIPAGSSTKTLAHYAQEIKNDGRFQQFDYGPEENMQHYGKETPPEYPVHKITLPIALLSGQDDWLSSVIDANKLYQQLVNPIEHYIVPMKEFSHLNFLFAKDIHRLVYDKLLELVEKSYGDFDSSNNFVGSLH